MKTYVDNQGTFSIKIPTTWKYSLQDEKVHTFQDYDIWKPDSFQISINPTNDEALKRFEAISGQLLSVSLEGKDYFVFPDREGDGFNTKSWTNLLEGKVVLFTFTYKIEQDLELDPIVLEDKLVLVQKVIPTFEIISDKRKEAVLNSYRFGMFLQGIGATAYMLNKSVENHAFIEATCLLASQIDGLLRIGIILQNQIDNNSVIEKEWIYQGVHDKKKSEKDVYRKAKELGVITEDHFKDLYSLYDDRNRVIHRFIISEITLADVEEIAYRYYKMQQVVNSIIYSIESKQVELGVGMTKEGSEGKGVSTEYIHGKLGKQKYFDEKSDK